MARKKAAKDDVLRTQKLQICEIAVGEGIQKNNESVLRWFTSEVLQLSWAWSPVVAMALLDKSKAGEYRWRGARNPLGLVRAIAKRSALKWNPELVFGNDADRVLRPVECAVSTLRGPLSEGGSTGTYADAEDETSSGGNWHEEFIDRAAFEADDYEGPEVWDEIDDALISKGDDGLFLDWDEVGRRIGLTPDQAALMKARAQRVTRADMGKHLLWDEQKVERVWRAVNRYLEKPALAAKARTALCAKDR